MVTQWGLSAVMCGTTLGQNVSAVDLRLQSGINGVGLESFGTTLEWFADWFSLILYMLPTPSKLFQLCNFNLFVFFFPVFKQNCHTLTFTFPCVTVRKTKIIFVTWCTLCTFYLKPHSKTLCLFFVHISAHDWTLLRCRVKNGPAFVF